MGVIIASARINENGGVSGGKPGDQKQKTVPDFSGELSAEPFYVHKLGWYVNRPKNPEHAEKIAESMLIAINNRNIGYDQGNHRLGVVQYGVDSTVPTGGDCGSTVRACVKRGTGVDPGNFNTANECTALENTGLFEKRVKYTSGMTLYIGDVLTTCTKGHTVIVVDGAHRDSKNYFKKYTGTSKSLVDALRSIDAEYSFFYRKKIAAANGVSMYIGTASQNTKLLNLLKQGQLVKP